MSRFVRSTFLAAVLAFTLPFASAQAHHLDQDHFMKVEEATMILAAGQGYDKAVAELKQHEKNCCYRPLLADHAVYAKTKEGKGLVTVTYFYADANNVPYEVASEMRAEVEMEGKGIRNVGEVTYFRIQ